MLSPGTHKITVETTYTEARMGGPLRVVLAVDGATVAEGTVPISAPLLNREGVCGIHVDRAVRRIGW
ncbi:hypothetical protein [Rhodococcus daqingensis]|uniref:Uncharacterized protein n=1 Tax=Rhodococcus daqingensis TaxID=2479363 RepID=A0ABW2RZC2_9NOCA